MLHSSNRFWLHQQQLITDRPGTEATASGGDELSQLAESDMRRDASLAAGVEGAASPRSLDAPTRPKTYAVKLRPLPVTQSADLAP